MSNGTRRKECFETPQVIEQYEIDPQTNQPVYYKTNFRGRNFDRTGDTKFSVDKARTLFPEHIRKKKCSGLLFCLNDKIRFQKKGRSKLFREQVYYRDIKYIYLFSDRPEAFMLGICEGGPCQYETYTVHSLEDRNKVVEVTQLKNPSGTVQTSTLHPLGDCASSLECSPEETHCITERCSMSPDHRRYRQNTVINDYTASVLEPIRTADYRRSPSPSPPGRYCQKPVYYERVYLEPVQHTPSPVHSRPVSRTYVERSPSPDDYVVYRRPPSHEVSGDGYVTPRLRRSVYSTPKYNGNDTDVTYVSPDPITGTRVTDDGPIYLYVQRRPSRAEYGDGYARRRRSASGLSIYR